MSKQVLPQPPSPTTTIFLEYDGASVMAVADDSLPVVSVLIMVLMVPSLDRVALLSRRSLVGRRCMPESWYFSCSGWLLLL